jgi:sulfate transport system substrate-binding protein
VDKVADAHGTTKIATEYLTYLYSPEGQEIAGKNFYRPVDEVAKKKFASQFAETKLVTIDDTFGGWTKAQATHFADGGTFDQIYQPTK